MEDPYQRLTKKQPTADEVTKKVHQMPLWQVFLIFAGILLVWYAAWNITDELSKALDGYHWAQFTLYVFLLFFGLLLLWSFHPIKFRVII